MAVTAAAGIAVVAFIQAAGTPVAFEAESGALAGGAVVSSVAGQSGAGAVKFASSSATPTPTPGAPVQYGWQLSAANTGLAGAGVNRNSLPIFTGKITAGMTVSNVKITSGYDLTTVSNVTFDKVWLVPSGGTRALTLGAGTVIRDSDIDGSAMPTSGERMGIYGNSPGNYVIERVAITNMTIGAWLDGDGSGTGSMTDSFIGNMVSNGGAHMDGFTRRAGTAALAITRCRVSDSGASVTGAFFMQNTWGGRIAGVMVKDTYLEGDGYVIGIDDSAGTSVGFDNVRVRSTGWGPISAASSVVYTVWSNVRIYDANRLPLADGAVLNHQ